MRYSNQSRSVIITSDGRSVPVDHRNADYASIVASGVTITDYVPPPPTTYDVDGEREIRLQKLYFDGVIYDFDDASRARIDKARMSALAAILGGAQPGDLRWANADIDFGWIAADNTFRVMDAKTMHDFGKDAASWEGRHITAARIIKNMSPIPLDYTDDKWWP